MLTRALWAASLRRCCFRCSSCPIAGAATLGGSLQPTALRTAQRHHAANAPASASPSPDDKGVGAELEENSVAAAAGGSAAAASATTAGAGDAAAAPSTPEDDEARRLAARDAIIQEILSRDKVVFELKRQHELSMLRVEQNQARVLKDQEDRGMYYEQNNNVHTFDTISVGLYSQRSTLYHTMSAERLRNFKVFLMVFSSVATCVYLYYRYMINPDWAYVERPLSMIGSRVQAIREQRWKHLSEEARFEELRKESGSRAQ